MAIPHHLLYRSADGKLDADSIKEFWAANYNPPAFTKDKADAEARTVRLIAHVFDVTEAEAEGRARELGLIGKWA